MELPNALSSLSSTNKRKIHSQKMSYFFSKKAFLIFRKSTLKKFLYFGKWNFLSLILKKFLYFLKRKLFLYFGKRRELFKYKRKIKKLLILSLIMEPNFRFCFSSSERFFHDHIVGFFFFFFTNILKYVYMKTKMIAHINDVLYNEM